MALRLSTGLVTRMLGIAADHDNSTLQKLLDACIIDIYTGAQPAAADNAPAGTLLCSIFSDGVSAGLHWDDASAGVLPKKASETWSGTAVQTGTAGWFRIRTAADAGGSSTTLPRIDGACATSGAQLNMSSTSIVSGAVQTISGFTITFPES
jgi:hypothetical protein